MQATNKYQKRWHIISVPAVVANSITHIEFKTPPEFLFVEKVAFSASKTGIALHAYILGFISLKTNTERSNPIQRFPVTGIPYSLDEAAFNPQKLNEPLLGNTLITADYQEVAGPDKAPYDIKIYLYGTHKNKLN